MVVATETSGVAAQPSVFFGTNSGSHVVRRACGVTLGILMMVFHFFAAGGVQGSAWTESRVSSETT